MLFSCYTPPSRAGGTPGVGGGSEECGGSCVRGRAVNGVPRRSDGEKSYSRAGGLRAGHFGFLFLVASSQFPLFSSAEGEEESACAPESGTPGNGESKRKKLQGFKRRAESTTERHPLPGDDAAAELELLTLGHEEVGAVFPMHA